MKISIIYHTNDGAEKQVANWIADGAAKNSSTDVSIMDINSTNHPFILASDLIFIGISVHQGVVAWEMVKWMETKYTKGQLKGKMVALFCVSDVFCGENALLFAINCLLGKGMFIYSGGNTNGEPFTNAGFFVEKNSITQNRDFALLYGERISSKCLELYARVNQKQAIQNVKL